MLLMQGWRGFSRVRVSNYIPSAGTDLNLVVVTNAAIHLA